MEDLEELTVGVGVKGQGQGMRLTTHLPPLLDGLGQLGLGQGGGGADHRGHLADRHGAGGGRLLARLQLLLNGLGLGLGLGLSHLGLGLGLSLLEPLKLDLLHLRSSEREREREGQGRKIMATESQRKMGQSVADCLPSR